MASPPNPVRKITQFARQAQYLSERENPVYSPTFKAAMRYIPLAMRLYRFKHYYDMERDYAGFDINTGRSIRQALAKENEAYVKRAAPQKYWDALIPKTEIGCKRKVLDTDYLKSLWQDNVELISNDPVEKITETGVVTKSGKEIGADAIVLAIGFATQQMLCPMEIVGKEGLKLNDYVSRLTSRSSFRKQDTDKHDKTVGYNNPRRSTSLLRHRSPALPQLLHAHGPRKSRSFHLIFQSLRLTPSQNTVTGHLSVIYTVECQINFTLRLLTPILQSLPSYRSASYIPRILAPAPPTVEVLPEAALEDSRWTQDAAKKLVWASGCTNWAVDAKTGMNNMMYPDWQFAYWWRSVFWKKADFVYRDENSGKQVSPGEGMRWVRRIVAASVLVGAVVKRDFLRDVLADGVRGLREVDAREMLRGVDVRA
jgi:hypothetical protein